MHRKLAAIEDVGLGFIAEVRAVGTASTTPSAVGHGSLPAVNHLVTLSAAWISRSSIPRHKRTNPISVLGLSAAHHLQHIAHLVVFLGQLVAPRPVSALQDPPA